MFCTYGPTFHIQARLTSRRPHRSLDRGRREAERVAAAESGQLALAYAGSRVGGLEEGGRQKAYLDLSAETRGWTFGCTQAEAH